MLIGVPNAASLIRVEKKLQQNQIPHYSWKEPDFDLGFTAIATGPISGIKRQALSNYRLYSPGTAQAARFLTEDGATTTCVAPIDRASCSNQEGCG